MGTLVSARSARKYGGRLALMASAIVELALSMLMAPVMMLIHTEFIARILCGRAVGWAAQPRDDRGVAWSVALRRHFWHVAIGIAALVALLWGAPGYLPWVMPVIGGLMASVAFTVVTSSQRSGLRARALRLLVTPEEHELPIELRTLQPDRRRRPAQDAEAPEVAPTPELVTGEAL